MKLRIYLLMTLMMCGSAHVYAQISAGGVPLGMQNTTVQSMLEGDLSTFTLPDIDNDEQILYADEVKQITCGECKKEFYGTGVDMNISIVDDGTYQLLEDSTRVWLVRVQSESAYALQFYFSEFILPDGAQLFMYNEDQSMVLGAYTSDNNPGDIVNDLKFGIEYIDGNSIVLEYHEPNWVDFTGILYIGKVVHVFRDMFSRAAPDYGTSDPCHINVRCTNHTAGWVREISSVALIQMYDNTFNLAGTCSGTLINNVDNTGDPLFLTASHCADNIETGAHDNTFPIWVFKFGHQTGFCSPPANYQYAYRGFSVSGASQVARQHSGGPQSDYLLLRLNATVNDFDEQEICYAGWVNFDSYDGNVNEAVGIHHPNGDVKKFSKTETPTQSTEYSQTVNYDQYEYVRVVDWTHGVTAPGSSGSPLFNTVHQIIGQLRGGGSECVGSTGDNGKSDWYGKMWANMQDSDFEDALDPRGLGHFWANTFCPSPPPEPVPGECEAALRDGMSINGNMNASEVPCISSSSFILGPLGDCETPKWDWPKIKAKFRCGKIPDEIEDVAFCVHPLFKRCTCSYYQYYVSIREVDENGYGIGPSYGKQIYAGSVPDINYGIPFNSTTLSKLGTSLKYGSYYEIYLEGNFSGKQWAVRRFRYMPYDLDKTGTIATDLYAENDITLSNATVLQDIDVVAGHTISILETSSLQAGSYRIATVPLCEFHKSGVRDRREDPDVPVTLPQKSDPEVSVYPNPTTGRISMDLSDMEGEVFVEIVDNLGKTQMRQLAAGAQLNMDLSRLPDGIYYLRISNGVTTVSRKVVKM